MRLLILLVTIVLSSFPISVYADDEIEMTENAPKNDGGDKRHRSRGVVPVCMLNTKEGTVTAYFGDDYTGEASLSVLSSSIIWSKEAVCRDGMIVCHFDSRPGDYYVLLTMASGRCFSGCFSVN